MKSFLRLGVLILGLFLLMACQAEVGGVQLSASPSPNPSPQITATQTPLSPGSQQARRGIQIWLPPQFDPNGDQPANRLLRDRLQAFYEQFANLPIEVRLKAEDGPGGMLEALLAASEAAPLALPDIVLLPRKLVAPLAQSGILHPLGGYIQLEAEQQWYPFARQLVTVENTPFGIPFVGDALLLAYPQSIANELPLEWNDWLVSRYTLGFAAADPQATVMLALYLQAGGAVRNAQGKPMLEETVLTEVLEKLNYAYRQGKLPPWVIQAETDQMVSQALAEGKIDSGYLWGSNFLKNDFPEYRASAGFLANKTSLTLANGWIWASTSPIPDHIGISFQLVAFLSEAEFIAAFTQAGGYIPTRADAYPYWQADELTKDLDTISQLAQALPPSPISDPLGIALRNAILAVIKDRIAPQQAAKDAIANLSKP